MARNHGEVSGTSCLTLSFASLTPKPSFDCGLLLHWEFGLINQLWQWHYLLECVWKFCSNNSSWTSTEENATHKRERRETYFSSTEFDCSFFHNLKKGQTGKIHEWGRRWGWPPCNILQPWCLHPQLHEQKAQVAEESHTASVSTLSRKNTISCILVLNTTKKMFT